MFLVKENLTCLYDGFNKMYLLLLKKNTDNIINNKQGIPENAKAKIVRLPIVVLVRIQIQMNANNCPLVWINEDSAVLWSAISIVVNMLATV